MSGSRPGLTCAVDPCRIVPAIFLPLYLTRNITNTKLRLHMLKAAVGRHHMGKRAQRQYTSSKFSFFRASISVVGRTPITGM